MKSTGIVRKIDGLGRIVLPIELRRTLEIGDSDSLEIFIEDNTIILKNNQPACVFCGNAKDISTYKGRNVCPDCARETCPPHSLRQAKRLLCRLQRSLFAF